MKKMILAFMMVFAMVTGVFAAEIGLKAEFVQDFNVNQGGGRVELAIGQVSNFVTPKLNVTMVDQVYNRYGIGGDFFLYKYKMVTLDAIVTGVYQQTAANNVVGIDDSGFGATAGLKATAMVNKNVGFNLGYEYFMGDNKIKDFEGGLLTAGIVAKF